MNNLFPHPSWHPAPALQRYIALKTIAERILEQFDGDQFGDFKGTLLGLLSAYNYELRILQAATRLMSGDAFQTLRSLYRRKAGRVAATPAPVDGAAAARRADQAGDRQPDSGTASTSAAALASSSAGASS